MSTELKMSSQGMVNVLYFPGNVWMSDGMGWQYEQVWTVLNGGDIKTPII